MADSPNKTHIPSSTKPPKSKSLFTNYYVSKSLMIILVILVFSYFPSQVPEMFKDNTIITKLWDLIYLLVIGITVSYGLFSRKIDSVHPSDDNIAEKETYLSGISQISSIFEDGPTYSYGFDQKSWVEGKGLGSTSSEIGGHKKMSQHFLGESLVVINDEKYVVEQLGRQNHGSKSLDSAAGKSVGDSDSDSRNWFKESKKGKFRGLVPVKLEEKFKESGTDSDSDSDSRTRFSKSMRLDKRDGMFTSHVDGTGILGFEGVKSQSVRYGMPFKIKNLSGKEESKGIDMVELNHRNRNGGRSFSEINSQLSEIEIVNDFKGTLGGSSSEEIVKDFGKVKVDDGAFDSKTHKQFVRSKSQSSSIGASSETLNNMFRKEEKSDTLNSIPKPANTYKRGKSVRTNRSKEQVLESKVNMFQSQTDDDIVETLSKPRVDEMNANVDELSDIEPHSGEVDRKAEEFIAKFKEQIRLQKVASARKLNLW